MDKIVDWNLTGAPFVPTPPQFRRRTAVFYPDGLEVDKLGGGRIVLRSPLYEVTLVDVKSNESSHIAKEDFEATHRFDEKAAAVPGIAFDAEKTAGCRAAVYLGPATKLATQPNDPDDPTTWPTLSPGDVLAIGTDSRGNVRRVPFGNGEMHVNQYPNGGWETFVFGTGVDRIPVVDGPLGMVRFETRSEVKAEVARLEAIAAAEAAPATAIEARSGRAPAALRTTARAEPKFVAEGLPLSQDPPSAAPPTPSAGLPPAPGLLG